MSVNRKAERAQWTNLSGRIVGREKIRFLIDYSEPNADIERTCAVRSCDSLLYNLEGFYEKAYGAQFALSIHEWFACYRIIA